MAQQVKVFIAKPDNLTSTTRIHKVEGEDWLLQADFWPPHMRFSMCVCVNLRGEGIKWRKSRDWDDKHAISWVQEKTCI